jgi:hypothetical protein
MADPTGSMRSSPAAASSFRSFLSTTPAPREWSRPRSSRGRASQPVEIVDHFKQPGHQRRLGPVGQLDPFLRDAFAIIIVLGREPETAVFRVSQLALESLHRAFGWFHRKRRSGLGARWGGVLAFFWYQLRILHCDLPVFQP